MANSQLLFPPDPQLFAVGQILRSFPVNRMAYTANWTLASGGCSASLHHYLPDAYAPGWFQHTGAAQNVLSAPHLHPILSRGHVQSRCKARATVAGGGAGAAATLTFTSSVGAVVVGFLPGGPVDAESFLTVDSTLVREAITVEVETFDGATVTVHGMEIQAATVVDPIPAGLDFGGRVAAFGVASITDNYPADARLNGQFRKAITHLRARRRTLWGWSGLDPALGDETMHPRQYRGWTFLHQGALDRGVEYEAHFYARNATAFEQRIYLLTGDTRTWPNQLEPIAVPAATDGVVSRVFQLREERSLQGIAWPSASVGVQIADPASPGHGETTAEILAVTVDGP